jgi:hypothetical protein
MTQAPSSEHCMTPQDIKKYLEDIILIDRKEAKF